VDPAVGESLSHREREIQDAAREAYQERLDAGVSREQARKDLPLATYTEAYWKIDLHNLLHFLSLRMDDHAQVEIREYAKVIGHEIVSQWCPIVWEAFLDYSMEKMILSRLEIDIVGAVGRGDKQGAIDRATEFGWLKRGAKGLLRHRERNELEQKLKHLNLPIPWRE
jgi:thymidylate synthase (FAD)